VKTAAPFVLLWLAPLAFGQSTAAPQPVSVKTGAAVRESPARPAATETSAQTKTQEQDAKSAAKMDPEKEAAIRKLFEIQGTRKSMGQVIAGMSDNMKPTLSKMLPRGEYQDKLIPLFFEKFQSKLKTDDLLDLTIPIYDKYLSKEDVDGLAQFYQTPLGKKMISVLPQLLIESQSAAMNLGQQIGRQSMLEVLAEHPDLEKAMEEASARKN
jgi:uncharacterized protein